MAKQDFQEIFTQLKRVLQEYEGELSVRTDHEDIYYLETESASFRGKPLFFGSANIKKNYVSFYMMPVYVYPDLLDEVPDYLKKRMQGKSCFNFKELDEQTLADLRELTRKGFERYRQEGML